MENGVSQVAESFVQSQIWMIAILFIVTYILINTIKNTAAAIFSYLLVKSDVYGIGSYIEYKGKRYIIRSIGIRRIHLEPEDHRETRYIRTQDWKSMELIVPDDLISKK
jgi:hypothetical protein